MEYTEITSRKNQNIVFASSLEDKKIRDKERVFSFEGFKLLEECLKCDFSLHSLYFTNKGAEKYAALIELASYKGAKLYLVSDSVYDKLTDEKAPQGIFTIAYKKSMTADFSLKSEKGIIFLDGVQNPSNFGTIIRSADALGNYDVVYTKNCADVYNSKTIRGSMGAVFRTSFFRCDDIEKCFLQIKQSGRKIFGTVLSQKAIPINSVDISPTDCLVIGSEGKGISPQVSQFCDHHVIIPMSNGAESLNAAAACAIFIWEANRQ